MNWLIKLLGGYTEDDIDDSVFTITNEYISSYNKILKKYRALEKKYKALLKKSDTNKILGNLRLKETNQETNNIVQEINKLSIKQNKIVKELNKTEVKRGRGRPKKNV